MLFYNAHYVSLIYSVAIETSIFHTIITRYYSVTLLHSLIFVTPSVFRDAKSKASNLNHRSLLKVRIAERTKFNIHSIVNTVYVVIFFLTDIKSDIKILHYQLYFLFCNGGLEVISPKDFQRKKYTDEKGVAEARN